jgi:hypothetical protein
LAPGSVSAFRMKNTRLNFANTFRFYPSHKIVDKYWCRYTWELISKEFHFVTFFRFESWGYLTKHVHRRKNLIKLKCVASVYFLPPLAWAETATLSLTASIRGGSFSHRRQIHKLSGFLICVLTFLKHNFL